MASDEKTSNPSPAGLTGRGPGGRFAPGNRAGRGNPLNRRVQKLRAALVKSATADDVRAVVAALIDAARKGDVAAAREFLDRVVGKPIPAELLARLEALEARAAAGSNAPCSDAESLILKLA